ncbi:hypothetical protein RJ639_018499 [Escallonia herrerae]|uniref:Cysteine-rich receptor-like protein kinase 3 n=1 Tax=Escallonia herrerae TaxID=1293975 RepID=A0AA88V7S5_9ASTE|nr:hypothetical protein RJ639_018499 [Escallonia herrerae]
MMGIPAVAGWSSWQRRWWRMVAILLFASVGPVTSDPQTNLLNRGCSQYNATNLSDFFSNRNATFADIRSQLTNSTHFATAQQSRTSDPVYAMAQCRNYLATADCVACFDAAVSLIRNCSAANGARVIYDGCFLRYESNGFYDQTTQPGNVGICSNQTASQATAFNAAVEGLLTDLVSVTPRINDFYAATTRGVIGSSATVYAVAQCAETVSESGCQDCLAVANSNIQSCPPRAEGSAIDSGCFLRYSDTSFFSDNQTTNITPFLGGGESSKKKAIIGGVVGGGGLLLLIVAFFIWYLLPEKPKVAQRGNILGATELQGPVTYSYKDLKSATKNFSEEYKLGEGGSGDVYKGIIKNASVVAVKKLAVTTNRAKSDFEREVRLISNVHHRNLIRLLGCSSKGPDLLLVYEYMGNGSLDRFLYVICICFGGWGRFNANGRHENEKGSTLKGYTAPEYAIQGQLSEKVDTYSFGVVILEIISGRRCTEGNITNDIEFLLEHAWKLYEIDTYSRLVDETLDPNDYRAEDVKKLVEIALLCTQHVSLRPTMSEVVVLLLSDRSLEQKPPRRPTFVDSDNKISGDTSTYTNSSTANSVATATYTEFTGR